MHLSRKDCELYYQHQVGGNYFQGAPYQRGYGFFGDLRRHITPLMFRAGKYLGKQMLETGKNVFKDYASGSSLKDSVRTRLRQTSKQIKDDFFQKLQQGKGIKRRPVRKPKHSKAKRRNTNPQKDIFYNG
ncbi:uncharacterized protein TNCT_138001 [Trichonephila clavata]|uniref:Uncharacterized protein n=1 Tax=Trichonephila clavata TaxID=2740835 RepID=A0A8X6GW90_TRICU|nr:uncharacterized protein TNCT_138001 [Trichonephila clavata]